MKKHFLPLLLVFVLALSANAQNTTFMEGDKVLNLGLGIGSTLYTGNAYGSTVPPLSASIEFSVVDELFDENSSIGVGGYLGYAGYNYNVIGTDYGFNNIILGGRGALHYQFIDNLDTYAGLLLGYRVVNWNSNDQFGSAASGGFISAFYVGGRYYFSENLAGMLELGYGIAYLNIGVALRF